MIDIIWEIVYNIARNLETLIQKKGGQQNERKSRFRTLADRVQ